MGPYCKNSVADQLISTRRKCSEMEETGNKRNDERSMRKVMREEREDDEVETNDEFARVELNARFLVGLERIWEGVSHWVGGRIRIGSFLARPLALQTSAIEAGWAGAGLTRVSVLKDSGNIVAWGESIMRLSRRMYWADHSPFPYRARQ